MIYIRYAKFIKVHAAVKKPTLVKRFVMSKNVGQIIFLLVIDLNQLSILLITKNTLFCGVFYLLLQKIAEHIKTSARVFIAKLKPSLKKQADSHMLTLFRNGVK